VEIHRLNNLLHPIPRPAPVYPEVGPQVIVADDDGMEVDGPAAVAPPLHEDVECNTPVLWLHQINMCIA